MKFCENFTITGTYEIKSYSHDIRKTWRGPFINVHAKDHHHVTNELAHVLCVERKIKFKGLMTNENQKLEILLCSAFAGSEGFYLNKITQ